MFSISKLWQNFSQCLNRTRHEARCCHEATGLVVACVAGGHILLATAGIAGLSFNAAQYMMDCGFGKSDNVNDPTVFVVKECP